MVNKICYLGFEGESNHGRDWRSFLSSVCTKYSQNISRQLLPVDNLCVPPRKTRKEAWPSGWGAGLVCLLPVEIIKHFMFISVVVKRYWIAIEIVPYVYKELLLSLLLLLFLLKYSLDCIEKWHRVKSPSWLL